MKLSSAVAAIAVFVSGVFAQAPANFTPTASAPLRVVYNSTVITPGIRLPPSGELQCVVSTMESDDTLYRCSRCVSATGLVHSCQRKFH